MIPDKPYELGKRELELIQKMMAPDSWVQWASCKDSDEPGFTAERTNSAKKNAEMELGAKEICADCIVRIECLDHALHLPEIGGIWGRLNEAERFSLMKRLRISHV